MANHLSSIQSYYIVISKYQLGLWWIKIVHPFHFVISIFYTVLKPANNIEWQFYVIISLTSSYLTCSPVEIRRFQMAVTKAGNWGENSSSYFWAYSATLSQIWDFTCSNRPASSSSFTINWKHQVKIVYMTKDHPAKLPIRIERIFNISYGITVQNKYYVYSVLNLHVWGITCIAEYTA